MLQHRPSDSGAITSRGQTPKDSPTKPKRQRLNPVVSSLTKAGLRADLIGMPDIAQACYECAESLAVTP